MQAISFLLHSFTDEKATTIHGCCTTLDDAKSEIQKLAKKAFLQATSGNKMMQALMADNIPILSFEHYMDIAKCQDPHGTYFLGGYCLVYANEDSTMVELVKWANEYHSSWLGLKTCKVEGPKLVRTFVILGTDESPEGIPLVLKATAHDIPIPPPLPDATVSSKYVPAKKDEQQGTSTTTSSNKCVTNQVHPGSDVAKGVGFPISDELRRKIQRRRDDLALSCVVTETE